MPDSTLQDIKDRLNITDVISGYIQLKKAGVNFKAPCPFHLEKTPSLVVSPQKQIWHCFGCGEGGDVFGFVMKYENLEFRDALKLLADKAGVKLPTFRPENKQQEDEKDLLLRINSFAAAFYHKVLNSKQGEAALNYLTSRGLTKGTIERWQIGFAPDDFHALERALIAKKVNQADMVKAGVSVKNERGQVYDRFRGRVTFPIFNYFGEVVGFSARILLDDGKSAKYVNSPETLIYNKSKTLFGLNFAKEAIRKQDEMVVVEGQMDCISLHQAGFNNVIASSGTAYNESAMDFTSARRLSSNVKLCFDSDSAGQKALKKTGDMLLRQGFRVKVIQLFAAKDPDELVHKSPGLWEKAVKEAVWFLDHYTNLAIVNYPPGSVEQNLYISENVLPLIGFIQDPLEKDHYIYKIAKNFPVSEKTIRDNIKKQSAGKPVSQPVSPGVTSSNSLLLQKEVLGGLLFLPGFGQDQDLAVQPEDFDFQEIRELVKAFLGGAQQASLVANSTLAKEAIFMVESLLEECGNDQQKLVKQLQRSLVLLKLHSLRLRQQHLQTDMQSAELAGNKPRVEELNLEFAKILKDRAVFEQLI